MVSIVIPCYNEGENITKTLERLFKHIDESDYKENYEVVVVDSSTDNTYDLIQQSEYWSKDGLRIIRSKRQMFPGEARNVGIEAATFDIIVFVDSGFSFEHNWFYELVTPLMDHDDLDITWGRTYTSVVDDMDRMFAYLVESKTRDRKVLPNMAIRKKVFTDGHWFSRDLRAVEDTRFIQEISGQYNERHVDAVNLYSGHPKTFKGSFRKWRIYSYYSYMAGYRRKGLLSSFQVATYLSILLFFEPYLSIFLIAVLQSARVVFKSNSRYEIRVWEFPKLLAISFAIDAGRFAGSIQGFRQHIGT